ncbi:hypothetical protein LDO26_16515 [Luteimonas sp. BDR2-5]|uniref:hypothetical protein n=1 Tax=Proluteimonas luteida TaxID=2878685 RepID=UPI001E307A54|nr:hypothetical protein [Luteimonas sp. BDR2-5]MCD9029797.1 hypothetical protein [Luteimonas sp. BDR2-5]
MRVVPFLFLGCALVCAASATAVAGGQVTPSADDAAGQRRLPVLTADVGDAASFGRTLRWLGVMQADVALDPVCDPSLTTSGTTQATRCVVALPAPQTSYFQHDAVVRIRLPANASHSLLCPWLSPYLRATYANPNPPGGAAVVGRLSVRPTLTIDNAALSAPGLVDPNTDAPLAGRLTIPLTATETLELPLPADTRVVRHERDSSVCIAGISRRLLTTSYGLSAAQADAFFANPMTVGLDIGGSLQYIEDGWLTFGLRLIGD